MSGRSKGRVAAAVALSLVLAACSADDTDAGSTGATADGSTTTTVGGPAIDPESLDVMTIVEQLASDDLAGRDQLTPGSEAAQELLIEEVARFAEPAYPSAADGEQYLQRFDDGANILAVVPGDERADEFVIVGAHYDHLGTDCEPVAGEPDVICNGATDNATGVAAAIDIVRRLAAEGEPRRTVVLALWDSEEDGLAGARAYLQDPLVPVANTVGYVNFDIQGANLLPSLAETTILVGAETGGPELVAAADEAVGGSELDVLQVSLLFGQGRSDHAPFADAGVPIVFFTDANTGCYHTVEDDLDVVDFVKLDEQIAIADALTRTLVETDDPPAFDPDVPVATYDDAVEVLRAVSTAEPDFDILGPEAAAQTAAFLVDLEEVVAAGEAAFDDTSVDTLLGGSAQFVAAMADGPCEPYQD